MLPSSPALAVALVHPSPLATCAPASQGCCCRPAPRSPLAPVLPLPPVFLHREDRVLALLHLDPALLDSQLAFCGIAAATLAAPGLLLWAAHSSVITGKLSASRLARFWSLLTAGSRDDSGSSGSDSDGGGSSGQARSPRTPFVKLAYRCARGALPSLGAVPKPASLPALPPTICAAARPSSTAAKCRLRLATVPTSCNSPRIPFQPS